MLKLNNYICALDIGSSKIAACVALAKRNRISNVFFESLPSKGVKKGAIVDSIDLVSSISKLLKRLKAKSGIKIKLLYVNISGEDIVTKHSRAILPLAERGNKVITASDIERVNEQARILGSSLEEEIIHRIPLSYAIDSKSNLLNPLGLYSHKLEVDLFLVCGKLSSIQSLTRVINQAGFEIKELFFSGLATSNAVFGKDLKEGLNLFCDIGSDNTEILFFKDGVLTNIEILPLGGNSLTEKLQEEFKIPFDLAEDIRRSYGVIGEATQIPEDKEILVKKTNLYKPIKQRLVSEIITASAKSLCSKIKETVEKKVSPFEVNNFVVTGRTILQEGFIETLENILSIPVKLGRISCQDIPDSVRAQSELAGQKYLTYLTSLGMLCEAVQDKTIAAAGPRAKKPTKNILLKAVNRFKEVYSEYF
jgi:cell division protein FtsA